MKRSHMRLVPTKTLVRGGLALVNEHQFHLQIVMIREPFRADFAQTLQGQCFDTEKLELHVQKVVGIVRSPSKAPGIVSYNFRSLEPGGRSRSRGTNLDFLFHVFLKFTLLYHLSFLVDVFNNSFWEMCIKTTWSLLTLVYRGIHYP